MINSPRAKSAVACVLAAALIILSPGLPAYQAWAGAGVQGPGRAGMPAQAPAVAMLSSLSAPRFQGVMIGKIDLGQAVAGLSTLDLNSEAGRAAAKPVLKALGALGPNASERQILEAVAEGARAARGEALRWSYTIQNPELTMDTLERSRDRLAEAKAHAFLLDAATLERVKTGHATALEKIAARKILDAAKSWEKSGPGDVERSDVKGAEGSGASALSKSTGRAGKSAPSVSRSVASAQPAAPSKTRSLAVGALALAGAGAALAAAPGLAVLAAGVVGSILLHETAHLWMLRRLGDGTAAQHGVTSLNPLKLVDPVKTILAPLGTLLASHMLFGLPILFGAAKPIPVDFNKLADPKRDAAKVAIAGPAMNALLAGVFFAASLAFPGVAVLALLAKVNVALALFNMLPLPQLDGGKVLVGFLPQKLYSRWVANHNVAPAYRSTFTKLYEGPSMLLNLIGMTEQGSVNAVTRAVTFVAFAAFAAAAFWLGGLPVLLLMLVCSYDYYCIREKIQNEAATRRLMDIMMGFASEIAKIAEEDDSVQSVINTEKVEHSLKNALEDTIDQVVDSEGFDELDGEGKWSRLEAAYMDAAVKALKKEGMSADDEATIRRVLSHPRSRAFLDKIKQWIKDDEVFEKWHSEGRKAKLKDKVNGKLKEIGGTTAMLALAVMTGNMMGGGAFLMGTVEQTERPAPVTFEDAMKDAALQISPKEQGFLQMMLTEMKLEEKPPVVGRVDEVGKAYKNVTAPRGDINSVVIVGKAGTGKTAIPEGLAQSLVRSDEIGGAFELVKMRGRFLVRLNLARLLTQDDPAKSLDALLALLSKFNDANKRSGNKVVLFVDEIHQIFAHAKGEQMANLLKEPLRDGSLSIIAATTEKEYKKYMEDDEAFRRRMFLIRVEESSIPESMRMLQGARGYYEGLYEVTIEPGAMKAAAENSKFDQEVFLPGRAFKYMLLAAKEADFDGQRDRLTMAIADKMSDIQYVTDRLEEELQQTPTVTEKLKKDEPTTIELYNLAIQLTKELVGLYRRRAAIPTAGRPRVSADLVNEQIASATGVAAGQLTLGQESMDRYLKMEEILNERVIGQPDAVHAVAEAVRRNKAGLSDPNLPIARLLFTGPTGVGKTHLAKELARFLFKDPNAVHRFDMSEYMESHSVSRFTGSPPGYVGFSEGGQLTEAVRKKPYSVLLFDELEKAHPDVFDILLQILGDGRLTDGQGRTTDFKNTVILMTSNLAMSALNDLLEVYVAKWQALSAEQAEAEASGDKVKLAQLKQAKRALSQELAAETKALATKVTNEAMKRAFKPEFEGRLSGPPIVFERITPENAPKIVELNLRDLRDILRNAGHELEWTSQAVEVIADKGFDIRLGARPLKNAIDRMVTQTIAQSILEAARDHGGRVPPSKIKVTSTNGEITVSTEALPAKTVSKKEVEEGATEAVFTKLLNASLQGAAKAATGQAAEPLTLETLDAWVREALTAFPDAAEEPAPAAAPEAKAQAPKTTSTTTSKPAVAPNGVYKPGTAIALGAGAVRSESAHYDADRKDAQVKAFQTQLADALAAAGWPEREREALVRTVEDSANPFYGFVKLFVEHAKEYTPNDRRATQVQLSFELDGEAVKVVIHRNGAMDERENETLRRHFGGMAPASAQQSRDDAEQLVIRGKTGKRLLFDLHRQLARIPGARIGFATGKDAQGGAGTDYWIELAKPAPAPEPAPEETAAVRTPAEYAGLAVSPAQSEPEMPNAFTRPLNPDSPTARNHEIMALHRELTHLMQGAGYSREGRVAASVFANAIVRNLTDRDGRNGANVEAKWAVELDKTVLLFAAGGESMTPDDIRRLHEILEEPELRAKLEAARAQVSYNGLSVWVEIPGPGVTAPSAGSELAGSASALGLQPLTVAAIVAFAADAKAFSEQHSQDGLARTTVSWRAVDGNLEVIVRREVDGEDELLGTTWMSAVQRGVGAVTWPADTTLLNEPIDSPEGRSVRHLRLVVPLAAPPGGHAASSQADGTASNGGANAPSAEAASSTRGTPDLQKIITPAVAPDRLGEFWIAFRAGLDYERDIAPLIFRLGLTHVAHADMGQGFDVKVSVPDGAWLVGQKALDLAREPIVTEIRIHPDAFREAMRAGQADLPATPAAPPAPAQQGARGPLKFVILDNRVANEADASFLQAGLEIRDLIRGLGASDEFMAAAKSFLDRAARFAKERAREKDAKITIEWRRVGDALELAVRRELEDPDPVASDRWKASASDERALSEYLRLNADAQLRVLQAPAAVGKTSNKLVLTLPGPGAAPAAAQAGSSGDPVRDRARQLAYAIIAQAHERGPTVRMGAGDVLGAASSRADLAKARQWLTLRDSNKWAEISAAANVIARHGSREEDAAELKRLLLMFSSESSHEKNPAKRRLIEAFAAVHATDNRARLSEMMREFETAKGNYPQKLLAEALYVALARHGDARARELLVGNWELGRTRALAEYLQRVEPSYLRGLYDAWKGTKNRPDGKDRYLTLWAIAYHGDETDVADFVRLIKDKWGAQITGVSEIPQAADAFGVFAGRVGAFADREFRALMREWMREDISQDNTFIRVLSAVMAAGEGGGVEDLPELERMMRINPESWQTVSNYHEMSQHEAAVSWAKIVARTGLLQRYLTENEPASDGLPAMPKLMRLLADTNGVINKAALEAMMRLFAPEPEAAPAPRPRGRRAPPAPAAPSAPGEAPSSSPRADFFTPGAADATSGQTTTFLGNDPGAPGGQVTPAMSAGTAWMNGLAAALHRITGVPMQRSLTRAANGTLVWKVRSSEPTTGAAAAEAVEFVDGLLALTRRPTAEADRELARLARLHPEIEQTFRALFDLSRNPQAKMGLAPLADERAEAFLRLTPASAHPLFEEGDEATSGPQATTHFVGDDRLLADANSGYSRVPASKRALAQAWNAAFKTVFEAIFGTAFDRDVKIVKNGGRLTVVWRLRRLNNGTAAPERAAYAKEAMYMLLHLLTLDGGSREQRLNELERSLPGARIAFGVLQRIAADGGFKLGLSHDPARSGRPNRGDVEAWLRLEIQDHGGRSPDGPGDPGSRGPLIPGPGGGGRLETPAQVRRATLAEFKNDMLDRRFNRGVSLIPE